MSDASNDCKYWKLSKLFEHNLIDRISYISCASFETVAYDFFKLLSYYTEVYVSKSFRDKLLNFSISLDPMLIVSFIVYNIRVYYPSSGALTFYNTESTLSSLSITRNPSLIKQADLSQELSCHPYNYTTFPSVGNDSNEALSEGSFSLNSNGLYLTIPGYSIIDFANGLTVSYY